MLMETISRWIGGVNDVLWTYVLVAALLGCAVWFTLRTRGVQFRLLGEMMRVLGESAGSGPEGERHVSSFQAFAVSLASPRPSSSGDPARSSGCGSSPLWAPRALSSSRPSRSFTNAAAGTLSSAARPTTWNAVSGGGGWACCSPC